tara:strand:+ start:941 stop:1702 length:762 start_codon:yes stop_codon:yes gene_type:complete
MENIDFVKDCLFSGSVFHKRLEPFEHKFSYKMTYFWFDINPKKELFLFKFNKYSLFSFFDKDHGPLDRDFSKPLFSYLIKKLKEYKINDVENIKVLCLPRIFNYQFNPITIFVCFSKTNQSSAIIFQVSNTFGERHLYVANQKNQTIKTNKKFHVSPFFKISGKYLIDFKISNSMVKLNISYQDKNKEVLIANFIGKSKKINNIMLFKLIFTRTFQNFKVTLGIYYEALKLWIKGATYYNKPEKPKKEITKLK